jgi:hypothetical protein
MEKPAQGLIKDENDQIAATTEAVILSSLNKSNDWKR